MIDYDKLKEASELCCATKSYYFDITLGMDDGDIALFDANNTKDQFVCNPDSLDDLITKLKELTEPEPKYKDCWYVGSGGHPRCTKVLNQEGYAVCDETASEAIGLHVTCYPTKAALIESQIEYWVNQREPVLMAVVGKCPDCGEDMADYAGLDLDGKWRTGCSKRCGYYTTTFQAEPDYCNVSGVKLGKPEPTEGTTGCQHESDGFCYTSNPTQNKCIKCGEFYR